MVSIINNWRLSLLMQISPFFRTLAILLFSEIVIFLWLIGTKTSFGPIRSIIIFDKQIGRPRSGLLSLVWLITDRIELHSVLLPLLYYKPRTRRFPASVFEKWASELHYGACSNEQLMRQHMKNKTLFSKKWASGSGHLDSHVAINLPQTNINWPLPTPTHSRVQTEIETICRVLIARVFFTSAVFILLRYFARR